MKCQLCQSEFEPKNSLQKYCSAECREKTHSKKSSINRSKKRKKLFEEKGNTKECLICGDIFEVTQQHRRQKYCSKKCSRKAERVFGNKTETDLQYKDEVRFSGNRYKVLERDEYTCQICGNTHQLIVHHIDNSGQSNEPNNDMSNLITLCRRCHINIHKII